MTPEPLFRLRDFGVSFAARPILQGLNLDLPAHGITAILGYSGSGKTTLLRSLNRLNEEFPACTHEGHITLHGRNATVHDIYAPDQDLAGLRRRVGMVFQHPNPLPTTIRRNLTLPLRLTHRLDADQCRIRVEASLRAVQLWDDVCERLDQPAARLSGGQLQRLCLARALILEPEVLLLDEPTTSLDFRTAARIEDTLAALATRYPLILVSHSTAQAFRLAEHFVVLAQGRLLATCKRGDFGSAEAFQHHIETLLPE